MIIHLGYVALPLNLKDSSPNKTVTYKRFSQLPDKDVQLYKLKHLTQENLDATKRILIYNKAHDIRLYRFTSKLVPLVTHDDVFDWDYIQPFSSQYKIIGDYIKDNNLRVSAHPDHFTIINTPDEGILQSSIKDLVYHDNIFNGMNITPAEGKLVLHVGGTYGNKEKSMERFIKQFNVLDENIKRRIILENDDKSYTAKEVLEICKELKIPMVLDIHHHWCNNNGEVLTDLLEEIFNTWSGEIQPPKIHASSPKCTSKPKAHADFIDINFLMDFLRGAKILGRNFDIMIEAKEKDRALFRLMEEFKSYEEVTILDGASIKL